MTTFENTLHNTTATVRASVGDRISRRTERRVWKDLCGIEGCTCAGAGGVRGGDTVIVTYWPNDGKPFVIEARA